MKKSTVLLIEENIQEANRLRELMQYKLHYEVQTSYSPGSIKMAGHDKNLDLIVMGWALDGMKIFELRRLLDEVLPMLKIPLMVVFSKYSEEKFEQAKIKPGEIDFLISPVSDFVFINRVSVLVKKTVPSIQEKPLSMLGDKWIKMVTELSGIVVWELNCSDESMRFSKTFGHLLNFPDEKLPGNFGEFMTLIHPEERELFENRIRGHIVQNFAMFAMEHRIRDYNKEYRWVYNRAQIAEMDTTGQPLKMIGILLDTTYKKILHDERLKQLHQSESE